MTTRFSIHGAAANRVFSYSEAGTYNEFTAPGGAALVAQLLGARGLADSPALDGSYLRQHLGLERFKDTRTNKSYYAIVRRSGTSPGKTRIDTAAAPYALLWGADFDQLPVSADTPLLWASNAGVPDRQQLQAVAERCLLLLDADVLRSSGAMVSRQISWERTATELVWQLHNNPAISYLMSARHILVTFSEDAAVHITGQGADAEASLVLGHGGGEGWLQGGLQGQLDDSFAVMAAALALQFEGLVSGGQELSILPVLKSAESLMLSGYDIQQLKDAGFELLDATACAPHAVHSIPMRPGESAIDPDLWCISNAVSGKRVFDIAYDYVLEGSSAIADLPQLSFGALTTVDRWEIEAFQNIRNLIVAYAESDSVRPLSIAVFGSPGSGKSFGVTQIAKNVLPGLVEKLEFNVSQFTGSDDLGAAFQQVRDLTLEGRLPLVFFDEFDSDRDGLPLGWVKGFLMPMQDGKFKDRSGEHPLGKCILVFAGGTAASFEDFSLPMRSDDPLLQQAFKNVKGPDFVSRLRGSINVLGPNRKDGNDHNYILRRALLLRSLCERNQQLRPGMGRREAPISPQVLWAMLLVPEYKHGARSMEAILDMSRIDGAVWEPVSLPFYSQLSLHVDADAFIRLVLREVILNSYTEQLAQAIHQDFCQKSLERGQDGADFLVPWEQLPEDIRKANRSQAQGIAEKLRMIGYAYDAGDTPFPSVDAFDDATTLLLAQNEHLRWMAERQAAGWRYGSVRDNQQKVHPLLCPWDELPEVERQKDIDAANNIIPLLRSIGLRVYQSI